MDAPDLYPHLLKIIMSRFACRKYDSKPIPPGVLTRVLEAARFAPSACNRQPWTFYVVTEPTLLKQMYAAYNRDWITTAPAIIVAVGNHNEAWHRDYDNKDATDIDLSIAIDHITLAATALGLGTCWVCAFNAPAVTEALNLPEGQEPIALIPIGYPAADAPNPLKNRKSPEDIVRWK